MLIFFICKFIAAVELNAGASQLTNKIDSGIISVKTFSETMDAKRLCTK